MTPGHHIVGPALKDMDRRGDGQGRIQQKPVTAVLEQAKGQYVFAEARLDDPDLTVAQDGMTLMVSQTGPHQSLGKILGRVDQHQSGHPLRPRPGRQHCDPAAHGRAHQNHRPLEAVDHADRVLAPAPDRGLAPVA